MRSWCVTIGPSSGFLMLPDAMKNMSVPKLFLIASAKRSPSSVSSSLPGWVSFLESLVTTRLYLASVWLRKWSSRLSRSRSLGQLPLSMGTNCQL